MKTAKKVLIGAMIATAAGILIGGTFLVSKVISITKEMKRLRDQTVQQEDFELGSAFIGPADTYAEMSIYNNTTPHGINEANVYEGVYGFTSGSTTGWTFQVGASSTVSAWGDAGGGLVTATSTGHGLSAGEIVTISNTTNYNGIYEIQSATTNTFAITATWVADDAQGAWIRPGALIADTGAGGMYRACWSNTAIIAAANKRFKFELLNGVRNLDDSAAERYYSNTDTGVSAGCDLVDVKDGDRISMVVEGLMDTTDITIKHSNVTLKK